SATAASIGGNATIASKWLCGPGGNVVWGSAALNPAETKCGAMSDPYVSVAVPSAASASNPCNFTNFQTSGKNYFSYTDASGNPVSDTTGSNAVTPYFYYDTAGDSTSVLNLTPGVYCGGISTNGTTNIRFKPGIYVLRNGGLTTKGNTTGVGTGVVFYLTGSGTAVQLQDDFVDLSAKTT